MSNITIAPVTVNVSGANKYERQLSVIKGAESAALTACLDLKGKAGAVIRSEAVYGGLVDVAQQAFNGNFKPLAQMLSIRTGEPIVISSKASFMALPDMFTARKMKVTQGTKSGGYRQDKKTGLMVPNAALKQAEELLDLVERVVEAVREADAKARAERESAKTAASIQG